MRGREASRLATEHITLLESIGDPILTVGLSFAALAATHSTGEMAEVLRLAQRVIDLARGDPTMGNLIFGSPLAFAITFRGAARWRLGISGWKDDFAQAVAMARVVDPMTLGSATQYSYAFAIPGGALLPDATAVRETADALTIAERSGDEIALLLARGITLAHLDGPEREAGLALLAEVREAALQGRFTLTVVPLLDIHLAQQKATSGDLDGAIQQARAALEDMFDYAAVWSALGTAVFVETLLDRCGDGDREDGQAAIDRLVALPTDPELVLNEITLFRLTVLLARVHGDETAYRDYRDRYRAMAKSLGFEGHMQWCEEKS